MKIPGDTGHPWRLNKFVEYQHFAPAVDPLTYCRYAKIKNLDYDNCVMLAWYHSLTYCEITAAFLLERLHYEKLQPKVIDKFWKDNKNRLIFGSARKYVQNMDWFQPLMYRFMQETLWTPYIWLRNIAGEGSPKERYKNIEKHLSKWKYMGRFSIDLFTEAIIALNKAGLLPLEIEGGEYDWKKSSNLTSGMFNIFYRDEDADNFDKYGIITEYDIKFLNKRLKEVLEAVQDKYPEQNIDKVSVINKICSFRNLFKQARYGGFHHDRQLGNLLKYQENYPERQDLWDLFFQIRKEIFPKHMLGEYCGWDGIRPERKKLWVTKGLTGVESISQH